MASPPDLPVQEERLERALTTLAGFTRPDLPYTRLAFSEEDRRAREWVMGEMERLGLRVRLDPAGNIIARREGREPGLPALRTGSHLDTVRGGGRFDGIVGVIGALEALRALADAGLATRHPLEVVVFTCEEATVPGFTPLGSRAMAGDLDIPRALEARTLEGVPLGEALRSIGGDPDRLGEARLRPGEARAHLELHIEQGPELEREGVPIGAVTHIVGLARGRVAVQGRAEHAGTTPMDRRADALCGAAEVILAVERAARSFPDTVGTVGTLQVHPSMPNVIPGRVEMTVEVRSVRTEWLEGGRQRLEQEVAGVGKRRGLEVSLEWLSREEPVQVPEEMVALVEESARDLGVPCRRVVSRATHDSARLARVLPVGMVFVPSRGGKSHTPEEWTDLGHIALGVRVLALALLKLDDRLSGRGG